MASKIEDDIRDAFDARFDQDPGRVPHETRRVVRRVRRRRSSNVLVGVVAVSVFGATLFGLAQTWDSVGTPDVAQAADQAPRQPARPDNDTAVAAGEHEGRPWTLYGYATRTSADQNNVAGDFCHVLVFGDHGPGGNYACGLGENDALVPPQFIDPVWMTPEHGPEVFYGKVSPAADSVKIEVSDRQTLPARIYDAPADWAAPYALFVGFAPPGTDAVTLVVTDAQGNELERRHIEAVPTQ